MQGEIGMKKRNKVIAALLIFIALLMTTSLVLFLLYAYAKGSLHRLTMFSNPDQELLDAYKTIGTIRLGALSSIGQQLSSLSQVWLWFSVM